MILLAALEQVRPHIRRLAGRRVDPDDVLQDAAERYLRATDVRDPPAWLMTVARNNILMALRGRRAEPHLPLPASLAAPAPSPDPAAAARRLVAVLGEVDGTLVALRYLLGYSTREAADALALTVPAVKCRLSRALARLEE